MMRRREFITLLGGAVVWPFAVNAQQSPPVVGFLSSRSPEESAHLVEAFRGGLKDGGFIADSVSLAVSREKDGKLRIVYAGWDNANVVQPDGYGQARGGWEADLTPLTGSAAPQKLGPPS
jgi:hypothetical protein